MCGQRQQAWLLFRKCLRYRAVIAAGPGAAVRFPVAPGKGLPVEILQSGKRAGGEEGFPYIPDGSLNPPLLIARTNLARAGGKMIMGASAPGAWDENGWHHHAAQARHCEDYRITGFWEYPCQSSKA